MRRLLVVMVVVVAVVVAVLLVVVVAVAVVVVVVVATAFLMFLFSTGIAVPLAFRLLWLASVVTPVVSALTFLLATSPFFLICYYCWSRFVTCGQTAARRLKEEQTEGNWAIESSSSSVFFFESRTKQPLLS